MKHRRLMSMNMEALITEKRWKYQARNPKTFDEHGSRILALNWPWIRISDMYYYTSLQLCMMTALGMHGFGWDHETRNWRISTMR